MISTQTLISYNDPAFQKAFKQYYDDLGIKDFKHWDKLFPDMGKEEKLITYVLKVGETIIGFIQCQDIELTHWFFKERCGFIREVWVSKDYRKQGFGVKLFEHATTMFKEAGIKKMILTTETVTPLYTELDFKVDESYSALNKDIVMVKTIS